MLLIHVGMFRTGSTWLQHKYFVESIIGNSVIIPELEQVKDNLVMPHPLDFSESVVKKKFSASIKLMDALDKHSILSYECLSGHPYSGGYNSSVIADRLQDIFPNAKILMVVRNSCTHMNSIYKKYVREGGLQRIEGFLSSRVSDHASYINRSYFEYIKLSKYYIQLYGERNVLLLPYELLKHDPKKFAQAISSFSGIKADISQLETAALNTSGVYGSFIYQRWINLLLKSDPILGTSSNNSLMRSKINYLAIRCMSYLTPNSILMKWEDKLKDSINLWREQNKLLEADDELNNLVKENLLLHGLYNESL
jgi:hypothetical protein